MRDFVFENKTKIYFGKEQMCHLHEEVARFGKRVLMVYGGGSIKRTGIYDKVMAELQKAWSTWPPSTTPTNSPPSATGSSTRKSKSPSTQ